MYYICCYRVTRVNESWLNDIFVLPQGHLDPLILDQKVQEALSHVDMAFVSLCFEAFRFDDGIIGEAICAPLYSEPIANASTLKLLFKKN